MVLVSLLMLLPSLFSEVFPLGMISASFFRCSSAKASVVDPMHLGVAHLSYFIRMCNEMVRVCKVWGIEAGGGREWHWGPIVQLPLRCTAWALWTFTQDSLTASAWSAACLAHGPLKQVSRYSPPTKPTVKSSSYPTYRPGQIGQSPTHHA